MLLVEGNNGKGLIIEQANELQYESVVNEETNEQKHYINGLFAEADVRLRNPRIYRKFILEREEQKFQNLIKNKIGWGELEHPDHGRIDADRVCMIIRELNWDNNVLIGKAEILENDMGKKLLSFAKAGCPGVSSRGTGSVRNGYVQEDYNLITWDAVLRPSANSVLYYTNEGFNEAVEFGTNEERLYKLKQDIEAGKYTNFSKQTFESQIVNQFKKILYK